MKKILCFVNYSIIDRFLKFAYQNTDINIKKYLLKPDLASLLWIAKPCFTIYKSIDLKLVNLMHAQPQTCELLCNALAGAHNMVKTTKNFKKKLRTALE
jgi:hypothetical protein